MYVKFRQSPKSINSVLTTEIIPLEVLLTRSQWEEEGGDGGMSIVFATFLLLLLALQQDDVTDPGCSQWVKLCGLQTMSRPIPL